MCIKDILVHCENNRQSKLTMEAAFKVARTFNAHVNGLYINQPVPLGIYSDVLSPDIRSTLAQMDNRNVESAHSQFNKSGEAWENMFTFTISTGDIANELIQHSIDKDLLVVSQADPNKTAEAGKNISARLSIESARPTIVVPYIGSQETIGDNILIAWNGKRESVRALHDAMPFLKKATTVNIISVKQKNETGPESVDLLKHLQHHGISASMNLVGNLDIGVAEYVLSRASDFGSDLIVMGA